MWTIFVHNGQWKCERKNEPHTIWVVLSSLSMWKHESNTEEALSIRSENSLDSESFSQERGKNVTRILSWPTQKGFYSKSNKRCFIQAGNLMEHVSWWYFRKIKHVFLKWYHSKVTNSLRRPWKKQNISPIRAGHLSSPPPLSRTLIITVNKY